MSERIPVTDDKGNTVYLRGGRMGWGVRNRVIRDAMGPDGTPDDFTAATALLLHSIVAWEGPDFDGKPITMAALDDLDPDLGDRLLAVVREQNAGVLDPKASTNGTAPLPAAPRSKATRASSTSKS